MKKSISKTAGKKSWAGSRGETAKLAPKYLTINITKDDIENGLERDPNRCVAACSMQREHPDFTHISVDLSTIRYTTKQKDGTRLRHIHITPRPIQRIIIATDQAKKSLIRPTKAQCAPGMITVSAPVGRPKKGPSKNKRLAVARLKKSPRLTKQGHVPVVIGGKEPPVGGMSQRRGYGVRAMSL